MVLLVIMGIESVLLVLKLVFSTGNLLPLRNDQNMRRADPSAGLYSWTWSKTRMGPIGLGIDSDVPIRFDSRFFDYIRTQACILKPIIFCIGSFLK